MKKKSILIIIIDTILCGCCLIVFALFHHVLPKELESENIIIDNDNTNICNCNNEQIYSCQTTSTDNSYVSENISIKIETFENKTSSGQIRYHVADIHIKNIKSLQTVLAKDKFGRYYESILSMDKRSDAILSLNGDFYGLTNKSIVIRNGILYRSTKSKTDVAVLYNNGVLKVFSSNLFNVDDAIKDGAYQAWSFGPSLLDSDGKAMTSFSSNSLVRKNPRSAIGYYEPGHYAFVVVEGRIDESVGMTMSELSTLFESLGCKVAYNLDGGQSSIMVFNDKYQNNLCEGGRTLSDAIIIKEVTE